MVAIVQWRAGIGRYVKLYIAATMHSLKLCAVTLIWVDRLPMAPSIPGRRDVHIVIAFARSAGASSETQTDVTWH